MTNRRKLSYIAGFIALCWIATGALIGIFVVLAHFLKSTSSVITLFLVLFYSCLFGLLGWQVYNWKGKRDGWPSGKRSDRSCGRVHREKDRGPGKAEDADSGWK